MFARSELKGTSLEHLSEISSKGTGYIKDGMLIAFHLSGDYVNDPPDHDDKKEILISKGMIYFI